MATNSSLLAQFPLLEGLSNLIAWKRNLFDFLSVQEGLSEVVQYMKLGEVALENLGLAFPPRPIYNDPLHLELWNKDLSAAKAKLESFRDKKARASAWILIHCSALIRVPITENTDFNKVSADPRQLLEFIENQMCNATTFPLDLQSTILRLSIWAQEPKETVSEYYARTVDLNATLAFLGAEQSPSALVTWFVLGLNRASRDYYHQNMHALSGLSLSDICRELEVHELKDTERKTSSQPTTTTTTAPNTAAAKSDTAKRATKKWKVEEMICFACQKPGHRASKCTVKSSPKPPPQTRSQTAATELIVKTEPLF